QLHEEAVEGALPAEPALELEARAPEPVLGQPDHTLDDFEPASARASDTLHDDDSNQFADDPATSVMSPDALEEDVYTSASRPQVPLGPDELQPPEDPIAPPPAPARAPAVVKRTGPAIIRRTPAQVPVPRLTPSTTFPAQDDNPFAESTKIADVGQ